MLVTQRKPLRGNEDVKVVQSARRHCQAYIHSYGECLLDNVCVRSALL